MEQTYKPSRKSMISLLLALTMVFATLFPIGIASADSENGKGKAVKAFATVKEQPVMVATGLDLIGGDLATATPASLSKEKSWTLSELTAIPYSTEKYSSLNSYSTKRFYQAEGIPLKSLIGNISTNVSAISSDDRVATFNPSTARYFYPYFAGYAGAPADSASDAAIVEPILAFSNKYVEIDAGNAATTNPFADLSPLDSITPLPTLQIGQTNPTDVNNGLFNKNVKTLKAGADIPSILTIEGLGATQNYTRADLLMMPRVPTTLYNATYARGIDIADLVMDADADEMISFTANDGYQVPDLTIAQVREASDAGEPYILAYETGTSANALEAVIDIDKKNASNRGYLRIYHLNESSQKCIGAMEVKAIPPHLTNLLNVNVGNNSNVLTQADYASIAAISEVSETYSSNNTRPNRLTFNLTGITIEDLLTYLEIDTTSISDNTLVTFTSGSYSQQITWGQLNEDRYYFDADGTKGAKLPAILAFENPADKKLRNFYAQVAANEQTAPTFVSSLDTITIGGTATSWGNPTAVPTGNKVLVPGEKIRLSWAEQNRAHMGKIYYTTNGDEPTINSTMYNVTADNQLSGLGMTENTPIVSPSSGGAFTIKAKMFGIGRTPGQTVTFDYKIYDGTLQNVITPNNISTATFGSWKGTGKSAAAVIPGDLGALIFDHFTSLKSGSTTLVNGRDYTIARGGLTIQLSEAYLKKLQNGNHSFTLTYTADDTARTVVLPLSVTQLPTGWKTEAGKKVYYNPNGTKAKNWQKIGGKQYYFGSNGVMQTKWKKIGKAKYYFGTNGVMQTKWKKIGKAKYYFGTNGKMQTKWKKIGKAKYYFGTNGKMQTKWKKIGKNKYYFGTNGKMQTGKKKIGKKTYRFAKSGALKK